MENYFRGICLVKKPKIVCIIPVLPSDIRPQTLQSIMAQTVPVTFTILLTEKAYEQTLAAKVSRVLNDGIKHIKLEDFDYILRVDGDAALPPTFIEDNLKGNADVVGLGCAMLIKTAAFQKAMNSQLDPFCDDSAIHFEFMRHNLKTTMYTTHPYRLRKPGSTHNYTYWIEKGLVQYQLGYEPTHVFAKIRFNWRNILCFLGYIRGFIKHVPKCDCAEYVRYHQLQRLIHPRQGYIALHSYTPFNQSK